MASSVSMARSAEAMLRIAGKHFADDWITHRRGMVAAWRKV